MRRLAIALVFLAGCAVGGGAGQFVVPKANAADVKRWRHFCTAAGSVNPSELNQEMTEPGQQGFELVSISATPVHSMVLCFKRPADG